MVESHVVAVPGVGPQVVALEEHAKLEGVLARDPGEVVTERVGLLAQTAVLILQGSELSVVRIVTDGLLEGDSRHWLKGFIEQEVQPLNPLLYFVVLRYALQVGQGNKVLAAKREAQFVDGGRRIV